FGPSMTWAAIVGVFLQLWVNFEIGRYTIATGESVYSGFSRIARFFGPFFLCMVIATTILPGWATVSGYSLKVLLVGADGWGAPWIWTWITFGLIAACLLGPKYVYALFEKVESLLVVVITLGLIAIAARVASADVWRSVGAGALAFGHIEPGVPASDLFAALVFAGIGGTGNIFLCFYLKDKRIGMGALAPHVFNPLRGRSEAAPCAGYIFEPDAKNLGRWRAWFNHFRTEQVLLFWLCNTFTIILFIVGAAAALRPRGLVPDGFALATTQAGILAEMMGKAGEVVFLLVAFASLFSTQLGIIDGNARSLSDIVHCSNPRAQKKSLGWWYAVIAVGWIGVGAVLSLFRFSPWWMFVTSSCLGGVVMAVYCPLLIFLNHRYLPKGVRPGLVHTAMLALASVVYVTFAVFVIAKLV
ncbi:MAG: Nramp family divalent metal transporter, partial [Deltaproteobacteria bacterium]|nr:Nramp family divalent metal transporter [Deltaproteobacteria bacterium]